MIEKNCQKLNEKNGVPKGKKSYNLSEIMAILGICRSSATKLIRTNQFRSVRIGREVRVLKSDFDPLLRVQRSIIPFTSPNTRVRTLCFVKHPLVRQQPHRYLIG